LKALPRDFLPYAKSLLHEPNRRSTNNGAQLAPLSDTLVYYAILIGKDGQNKQEETRLPLDANSLRMAQSIISTCVANSSIDFAASSLALNAPLLSQISSNVTGLFDANREEFGGSVLWLSRSPHSQQRRPIRQKHRRRQFPKILHSPLFSGFFVSVIL
jgi:hypothetical protein